MNKLTYIRGDGSSCWYGVVCHILCFPPAGGSAQYPTPFDPTLRPRSAGCFEKGGGRTDGVQRRFWLTDAANPGLNQLTVADGAFRFAGGECESTTPLRAELRNDPSIIAF